MDLGKAIIDIFILILLMVAGWYLYNALGPGIPIIGHIAIAMFIICGASLLVLIAFVIKEILQLGKQ